MSTIFFTNGEPLQEKELMALETHAVGLFISDLYLGNNLTLLRKVRNPERIFTQLYRETILISIYFLNDACLKYFLVLVRAWNCWHFLCISSIPVQGGLGEQHSWWDGEQAQRCDGVLSAAKSPGVPECWYPGKELLDQEQLHWSHGRWFWFSMWYLSNAVCGHRKTQTWLWGIVIKHRHPGILTDAHCKPQNIGLLPADLL